MSEQKTGILLSITKLQESWEVLKAETQKACSRIAEHEQEIAEERAYIEALGVKMADLDKGLALLIKNQNR